MNHIGQKIKEIAEQKNMSVDNIAIGLNKTKQAVYDIFKKESIKTSQLIELSSILDAPVEVFFRESQVILESKSEIIAESHKINYYQEYKKKYEQTLMENILLKKILDDKDIEIELRISNKIDQKIDELEEKLLKYLRNNRKD